MSGLVSIPTHDQLEFQALSVPAANPDAPGMVLVQEIFGINSSMRDAAQHWAAQGYNVICPDLFWRQQPGIVLEPAEPGDFDKALALMNGMDGAAALADLDSARRWLKSKSGHDRVAVLGYCLGGRLSVEAAMAHAFKCAVSYYGVGLDQVLSKADSSIAPTLLHIAEKDSFLPELARKEILARIDKLAPLQAYVYPGCEHAFARPHGEHFDATAAALAEQRSLAFMAKHTG